MFPLPDIPGYVDVKEAARTLGVAESSVYRYIQSGNLRAYQAGRNIMVELETLKQFQPRLTGRPRKRSPQWRTSPDAGSFLVTYIRVHVRDEQQERLIKKLGEIKQEGRHLFPGTVTRYISLDNSLPATVTIQLVWKKGDMPDEENRQQDLEALKTELADVLNWSTVQYSIGKVIIHT